MVTRSTDREAQHTDRTRSTHPPRRARAHLTSYIGGKPPLASVALLAIALLVAPVAATLPADTPGAWVQTAKLTAHPIPELQTTSDLEDRPLIKLGHDDWFGQSIAVSGDTLAVGAPRGDNGPVDDAGEVRLYEPRGVSQGMELGWTQVGHLSADVPGDNFGWDVSLHEGTLLVGAPAWHGDSGAAYLYERSANGWTLSEMFTPSSTSCFGASVAIHGDIAVVGDPCTKTVAAFVFERAETGWTQTAQLPAFPHTWRFGSSVAAEDDTIVVGGLAGSAHVFERVGLSWGHADELRSPASNALSISGDRIAVGAQRVDKVTVFEPLGGTWSKAAVLRAPADAVRESPWFGAAVALSSDGDMLVVGAAAEDPSPPGSPELPEIPIIDGEMGKRGKAPGAVHIYRITEDGWHHAAKLVASDARSEWWNGDLFGASVAVAGGGDTVLAGAPRDACCDDPLNAGVLPARPCNLSAFACLYDAEQEDKVYTFTKLDTQALGGV